MAVLETLFVFAGLLLLTIMNRPSSTGSRAKRIVSSILLAAYLVAVIVCSLTFFKDGSNDSVDAPPKDMPKEERMNPKINYGTLTDARDGHKYKTVQIGNQTWMAENLNYIDTLKMGCSKIDGYRFCSEATCLDRQNKTCDVVGAFYTWAAAVDSARLVSESVNPEKCCFCGAKCSMPAQVQGICPDGWHLPSDDEWKTLFISVGGVDFAGQALKARNGWGEEYNQDAYGFSALPTGLVHMEHVLLDIQLSFGVSRIRIATTRTVSWYLQIPLQQRFSKKLKNLIICQSAASRMIRLKFPRLELLRNQSRGMRLHSPRIQVAL